MYKILTI